MEGSRCLFGRPAWFFRFVMLKRHEQFFGRFSRSQQGFVSALAAAFFMGLTPVFGKRALDAGLPPFAVAAFRTLLAAFLMGLWLYRWKRWRGFYIHPLGLAGALLAGGLNGLGSLFFYLSLQPLGAALGQLLFSLHPIFLLLWVWLDREPISALTVVRVGLAVPTVYLLTQPGDVGTVNWAAVGMMLLASALYALHVPINRRVLFEAPSPTVTFYTLTAMSVVVVVAYAFLGPYVVPNTWEQWRPLLLLALVTFLSRLTLFMGVKRLGSLHTMLLTLAELGVTLFFAHWWLGERLRPLQWAGVLGLAVILLLGVYDRATDRSTARPRRGGWLEWLQWR